MVEPLTPMPEPAGSIPSGDAAPKVKLRSPLEVQTAPAPTLTVLDEGGKRGPAFDFVVERPVTMVGRCGDLRLEDALVSRRHVALIRDHEGTLLSDLGGQNPALLNGAPVVRGATVRLNDGDRISIGETTIVYHTPRPPAPLTDSALLGPAPGATPMPFPMSGVALDPVLDLAPTPAPPFSSVPSAITLAPRAPRLADLPREQPAFAAPFASVVGVLLLMAGFALGGGVVLTLIAPPSREVAPVEAPSVVVARATEAPVELPDAAIVTTPDPTPTTPTPTTSTPSRVDPPVASPPARATEPEPPVVEPVEPTTATPPRPPGADFPPGARATCERLLGRAPTPVEEKQLGPDPAAWVTWLLAQDALHSRWWSAELAAFGLSEASLEGVGAPSLDALRSAATSVAFTRRHGGEVPFAEAVTSLLLGLHDGDPERPPVYDAARHVAAGWPRQLLGIEARTPRDLVRAAVKDPRFARAALERGLERVLDRAPKAEEIDAAVTTFFQDPSAPGALLRVVVARGLEG